MTKLRVLVAALALTLAATPTWAASTSPGKSSVYASANFNLPAAYSTLLSVAIVKGKSKRVLVADATLIAHTVAPAVLIHQIEVTDGSTTVVMEPGGPVRQDACQLPGRVTGCTVHGVFWLDLDANPSFLGKTLTINMRGGADFGIGIGTPGTAMMAVRMEKK
jgi:hypothetical protein